MNGKTPPPSTGDVIIEPPSDALRKKAPPTRRSLNDALKRIEQVVATAAKDYPARLARDVARLKELSTAFLAEPCAKTMEEIRFLAHDMKGQGGQFGYELVTRICDGMQTYLKEGRIPCARTAEVVAIHVEALQLVESRPLTGEGGAEGRLLVEGLVKLVKKELPGPAAS